MKRLFFAVPALLLLAVCCLPSVAQDEDLTVGTDYRAEVRAATYIHNQFGNQSWVRQYDGRTFNPFGIELLDVFGYKNEFQYWVDARDLVIGDEDIFFRAFDRNAIRFEFATDALTHRLPRAPAVDPFTFGLLTNLRAANPAIPALSIGRNWDSFVDLSPTGNYALDRRVTELSLYGNLDRNQRARLVGDWWQQKEGGNRQLLFRTRQTTPVMPSGVRGGVSQPIDRTTDIGTFGTDVSIGGSSAINYRLELAKFQEGRGWPPAGSSLNFLPLNSLTRFNSNTVSHIVKARSRITDQLCFTGVYINRTRQNASNDIPPGYVNAGLGIDKKTKLDSTNLALVFKATDDLQFMGRWRQLDLDSLVPPVFGISGGVPSTTPDNQALSRTTRQMELEGTYSGLRKAFFRFGYERRNIDRYTNPIHGEHEEFEHPFTSEQTDWNIWRAKARWYPNMRLNLAAGYENWSGDVAGYQGTVNERSRIDVNGTYMLRDDLALYGNYNVWDESNDQIRVAYADIPTLVTPPTPPLTPAERAAYQEERIAGAGQGYDNKNTTIVVGSWYAISPRLSVDANYARIKIDSNALWVIGTDPSFLPHLAPEVVPFKGDNNQWSFGATYALTPKWRLRGSLLQSNSVGQSWVNPSNFQGLGPAWTPFDVHSRQWMLGFSHDLTDRDKLDFDFTQGNWEDQMDAGQDGRFGLYRLAWSRAF